jgi:N-dimethylarginine dimethylaminohydrolase
MTMINQKVLMSGAEYFNDDFAINPYMDAEVPVNIQLATAEHASVAAALQAAGVTIEYYPAPEGCQDGVYTANWALCRGNKAILSSLPNARQAEQPHAYRALQDRGFEVIEAPYRFSGQGDALPCGNYLFMGSAYRTDPRMHQFVADTLGYEVISLQTIPQLDINGQPQINSYSGWPDSFFYDIDLALSILRDDLIAWCPKAFTPESQDKIRALPIEKIEVSLDEAMKGFACNLVSTGETVVMSAHAPQFQAAIEAKGFKTITPEISELAKGGGYIRCTTLTLVNK